MKFDEYFDKNLAELIVRSDLMKILDPPLVTDQIVAAIFGNAMV
jgi:hypothetical protein